MAFSFLYLAVRALANPTGEWTTQQARNMIETFVERTEPIRFLIHDRDGKFTAAFDEVFHYEGIRTIRTPVRAPRANAFIELNVTPQAGAAPRTNRRAHVLSISLTGSTPVFELFPRLAIHRSSEPTHLCRGQSRPTAAMGISISRD